MHGKDTVLGAFQNWWAGPEEEVNATDPVSPALNFPETPAQQTSIFQETSEEVSEAVEVEFPHPEISDLASTPETSSAEETSEPTHTSPMEEAASVEDFVVDEETDEEPENTPTLQVEEPVSPVEEEKEVVVETEIEGQPEVEIKAEAESITEPEAPTPEEEEPKWVNPMDVLMAAEDAAKAFNDADDLSLGDVEVYELKDDPDLPEEGTFSFTVSGDVANVLSVQAQKIRLAAEEAERAIQEESEAAERAIEYALLHEGSPTETESEEIERLETLAALEGGEQDPLAITDPEFEPVTYVYHPSLGYVNPQIFQDMAADEHGEQKVSSEGESNVEGEEEVVGQWKEPSLTSRLGHLFTGSTLTTEEKIERAYAKGFQKGVQRGCDKTNEVMVPLAAKYQGILTSTTGELEKIRRDLEAEKVGRVEEVKAMKATHFKSVHQRRMDEYRLNTIEEPKRIQALKNRTASINAARPRGSSMSCASEIAALEKCQSSSSNFGECHQLMAKLMACSQRR